MSSEKSESQKTKYIISRSYCFTSYKKTLEPDMEIIRYIIWGEEICPKSKRVHLQGYVEFFNPRRLKSAQKAIGDPVCHIEKRNGTRNEAKDYCMKDKKFTEMGNWENGGQGARTDLTDLMQDIKDGKSDLEICETKPDVYERFQKFTRRYRELLEEKKSQDYLKNNFGEVKLNEFQEKIVTKLEEQTERQVLWVTDIEGGSGKTFLSKHILAKGNCFRCTNGKTKDIAFAYKGEGTFIMDLSRSLEDHVNYDVIEQIKNGLIFSSKYESQSKVFAPPKVLILANFKPELTKLSKDRWVVMDRSSIENISRWKRICNKLLRREITA